VSPASGSQLPDKLFPNRVEEDQDVEMQPIVMGTPPFSSPDPVTDGIRMLPLEDQTTLNAAQAADQAAALRGLTDYESMSQEDLKSLTDERDLEVTRTEGEGRLRKSDYIAALQQDDASDMKASDFKNLVDQATSEEELQQVADAYEASGREYKSVDEAIDSKYEELQQQGNDEQ
jgi:protein-tyrosine-phosphatase